MTSPAWPDAAEVMGKAGAENFTVASRLLPAAARDHLLAIYGFARLADDLGDESSGDRLASLDWLDDELSAAAEGRAQHRLLVSLTPTIRACQLPLEPFRKLIEANRRDQIVSRYETFDELVDYCALSANPVGELVLRVFDAATPERLALSDRVCTGLQLVEHLQDIGEDLGRGRVYVPAEDLRRFECAEADLAAAAASPRLRALVRFEAARARGFLDAGAPLVATLRGRLRVAVAGFAAGGRAALDAIERADGDVLGVRCRPRKDRVVIHLASVLRAATGRRPADGADCPSGASPPERAGEGGVPTHARSGDGQRAPATGSVARTQGTGRRPADGADCPSGASPPEWAGEEGKR